MVSDYFAGRKVVGTDRLFALADALDCSARWLISGVDDPSPKADISGLIDSSEADWILVPRYDLFAFTAQGWPEKPEPIDQVPLRRDWLARVARHTTKLWLCDMPGGSMEDVAREGDELLCRDIDDEEIADGRVYVFMLDGRPLVRRALVTMKGLVLRATDATLEPMTFAPPLPGGPLEGLVPIGRVIGSIALRGV